MNVGVPTKLEAWINEKVASGEYFSAGEVVRAALWQFRASEMTTEQCLDELRQEIAVGLEQLKRGEATVYTDETLRAMMEEHKEQGRKRMPVSQENVA